MCAEDQYVKGHCLPLCVCISFFYQIFFVHRCALLLPMNKIKEYFVESNMNVIFVEQCSCKPKLLVTFYKRTTCRIGGLGMPACREYMHYKISLIIVYYYITILKKIQYLTAPIRQDANHSILMFQVHDVIQCLHV